MQTTAASEIPLSDETEHRVREAALAELGGGTVVRIRAGSAGAAYEARVVTPDGKAVTVRLDDDLDVLAVEVP